MSAHLNGLKQRVPPPVSHSTSISNILLHSSIHFENRLLHTMGIVGFIWMSFAAQEISENHLDISFLKKIFWPHLNSNI